MPETTRSPAAEEVSMRKFLTNAIVAALAAIGVAAAAIGVLAGATPAGAVIRGGVGASGRRSSSETLIMDKERAAAGFMPIGRAW